MHMLLQRREHIGRGDALQIYDMNQESRRLEKGREKVRICGDEKLQRQWETYRVETDVVARKYA